MKIHCIDETNWKEGFKKPKPFIKWVGGKRQLINVLIDNLPIEYDTYIEPFVGGGALLEELNKKGCYVMLSNSNSEFIKDLYKGYKILEIEASRFINCKGDKRRKAKIEVLIKNY